MSSPPTAPSASASLWVKVGEFLGTYGPTFAPLGTALFVMAAYFAFYVAFANCAYFGAGCQAVAVRQLLQERQWCPPGAAATAQLSPTPSPTPAVTVKTEGGGSVPQVTVQVTLPPVPPAAPSATPTQAERKAAVYTGRLTWLFLYAVSMIASLCALIASVWVIFSSLSERSSSTTDARPGFRKAVRSRFGRKTAGALFVALGVAVAAGYAVWQFTTEEGMPVLVPLIDCLVKEDVGSALAAVKFGNATALGLAFMLLLASCATLWPNMAREPEMAVVDIAARMRYLRVLLYVGMAALVVNVLRLRSLFHWALSFLPPPDGSRVTKILAEITTSVTSSEAASYTLLLAAIYVPAVFILRWRARALITRGPGYTQALGDEWLAAHGLNVTGSLGTLWPKLAAIVAPLLVGSLGELFKGLSFISQ